MLRYLAPTLLAAFAGLASTRAVVSLAARFGVLSKPRHDRWFHTPVPLLGGTAIWLATMVGVVACTPFYAWRQVVPLVLAGCGALGIGLVDDLLQIKPASKLTGQIAVGCLAVVAGFSVHWTGSLAVDGLVTVAWFVAVANAFNLLDNMDGLCAGVGAIAAISICAAVGDVQSPVFVYSGALAGACLGFLVFNFRPASIFMGDSGSLFIGGSLALLSLGTPHASLNGGLWMAAVPVLLLLIPIFDTAFVTLSRQLSARPATTGGQDHTSHRLVALGLSERQSVLLIYGFAVIAGASVVALERGYVREGLAGAGLLVVALCLLGAHLARVAVYDGDDFVLLKEQRFTPLLMELTYKRRVFEVLLDCALVILAYYGSYVVRFDRDLPQYRELFEASLPVVIACQLISFFVAGVYRGVWHHFTSADLMTYLKAVALSMVTSVLGLVYLYRFQGYSRSVFIIDAMALLLLLVGSRYTFRLVSDLGVRRRPGRYRVLVYGAGGAGALLAHEVRHNPRYDYQVVGFMDDDRSKAGKRLAGLPIFGGIEVLDETLLRQTPDFVLVSTDKLDPAMLDDVERTCHEQGTGLLTFEFALRPRMSSMPASSDEPLRV